MKRREPSGWENILVPGRIGNYVEAKGENERRSVFMRRKYFIVCLPGV
jgi:hypothetical protein